VSALVQREQTALAQATEQEMLNVLQNSLYPGAAQASIQLVLGYCRAAGLDPMLKPVHIVPVWDSKAKENRDVVMPGIGLYRTQAARTGQYAGMSEPVFGPTRTLHGQRVQKVWKDGPNGKRVPEDVVTDVETHYPEWCRIVVKRALPNGTVAEFPAVEYWLENYATASRDSDAPNSMWQRRPFAQLAKCAEAQALRKAFPELGAMPTADEMEGREVGERDITPPPVHATIVDPEAQAKAAAEAKQRAELIARLESAAVGGLESATAEFSAIGKDGRKLVGGPEWERIKATIKPAAEGPKPQTYAQIMASINEAGDAARLSEVLGIDLTHLSPQMQGELIEAGKAKLAAMEQEA
jgi:phage recombination protein Bet